MIKKKHEKGQGTIELLIAFFALFTIVFMMVQMALGLGVANYFQYATFMAARTLLAGATTKDAQMKSAREVLTKMVKSNGRDRFSSIAKSEGDSGDPAGSFIGPSVRAAAHIPTARFSTWEQGVSYNFSIKMYLLPMVAGAKRGESNKVKLTSETWLGRDPSEEECLNMLRERKQKAGLRDGPDFLFDNGC